MVKDENLNILAMMFHNGEEIEGPDGLAIMVDMALWNDACEAFENIIGNDEQSDNGTNKLPHLN